ncbi:hypothetical protein IH980_01610 [Patescibacteria group bacterium]|nr:hypothetical protein [Patescibacteria group bacterium]
MKQPFLIVVLVAALLLFAVTFLRRPEPVIDTVSVAPKEEIGEISERECVVTVADAGGPYYQANSPFRDELSPPDAIGESLRITGRILEDDCVTPVSGATLDIWHADASGRYGEDWYRGKVQAGDSGEYGFETIRPAAYGSGLTQRPAHIHYKVLKDGQELLTSQMYFDQSLLSRVGPTRLVALEKIDDGWLGRLDIVVTP